MRFEWDEFVAKHQLGRNAAEKVGINALFEQIHEGAAIAFGEAASLVAFGGVVRAAGNNRIVGGGSHRALSPGANLEGEERQIKGYQNKAYHNGHDDQNGGRNPDESALETSADFFFVEFGDAGEHGGEGAGSFADFDHFQGEVGDEAGFGEAFVKRLALAHTACGGLDRCGDEAASDGLRGSFQAGYERRATC